MITTLQLFFSGEFNFRRRISQPQISLNGTANFETGDGKTILYKENGQYRIAGKPQSFYQNRIFMLGDDCLLIFKEDHSPLHEFALSDQPTLPQKLTHMHQCANDQYFVTMTFCSLKNFSTFYQIIGPHKNYSIHTDYERA